MLPIWFWKEERENILYKNKYLLPHDSIVWCSFYSITFATSIIDSEKK